MPPFIIKCSTWNVKLPWDSTLQDNTQTATIHLLITEIFNFQNYVKLKNVWTVLHWSLLGSNPEKFCKLQINTGLRRINSLSCIQTGSIHALSLHFSQNTFHYFHMFTSVWFYIYLWNVTETSEDHCTLHGYELCLQPIPTLLWDLSQGKSLETQLQPF
jgi:hypothetical protein